MFTLIVHYRFIEIFIKDNKKYSKVISYVAIVLFSLLIIYDTKKIILNANNCVNPDYINESLGGFLDSINLFQNNYILSIN